MNIETPGLSVWIPGVSFKRKMVLTGDVGHPVFFYNTEVKCVKLFAHGETSGVKAPVKP